MKRALQAILRGYQRWISPALPPACRYTPTCSEYALEALERRGVVVGLGLAAWRVLRCHPFVKGGYDPVPHKDAAAAAPAAGGRPDPSLGKNKGASLRMTI